jgi:hypothetical protein
MKEMRIPVGVVITSNIFPRRVDALKLSIEQLNLGVPIFSVNSFQEDPDSAPVRGFCELCEGLRSLVKEGLENSRLPLSGQLAEKIAKAEEIIEEEASSCGKWAGWICFIPSSGFLARSVCQKRMLNRIMEVFGVAGVNDSLIDLLIEKYRSGGLTAALTLFELAKVVPIVGWFLGGLGSGLSMKDQTRGLGNHVKIMLIGMSMSRQSMTAAKVTEILRRVA